MAKVEFDARRFQRDVKTRMVQQGLNAEGLQIAAGLAEGSINRLMYGICPRKLDIVWSVAEVLRMDINSYRGIIK